MARARAFGLPDWNRSDAGYEKSATYPNLVRTWLELWQDFDRGNSGIVGGRTAPFGPDPLCCRVWRRLLVSVRSLVYRSRVSQDPFCLWEGFGTRRPVFHHSRAWDHRYHVVN